MSQKVDGSGLPNLVCTLPGTEDSVIIVGAHFDCVDLGEGVVDNWSGASLLPSLYEGVRDLPRRHKFVFIGFTDEEKGLVGSESYARRLPREDRAKVRAMVRATGCVAKVNLVLGGVPRFAGATTEELKGRIVIAPTVDYLERGADAAKYRRISAAPYLEAVIPSLTDPTIAPEGTHVMSVVAQWAPYRLRDGDWTTERDSLGDLVLKTLEHHAPGFQDLVVAREVLTPVDLEREFGVTEGHMLHGEPGLDQWFAWRPLLGLARYRMPIAGLYSCGSGSHPGGNVTGLPGRNAAREVLADLRKRGR